MQKLLLTSGGIEFAVTMIGLELVLCRRNCVLVDKSFLNRKMEAAHSAVQIDSGGKSQSRAKASRRVCPPTEACALSISLQNSIRWASRSERPFPSGVEYVQAWDEYLRLRDVEMHSKAHLRHGSRRMSSGPWNLWAMTCFLVPIRDTLKHRMKFSIWWLYTLVMNFVRYGFRMPARPRHWSLPTPWTWAWGQSTAWRPLLWILC